MLEDIERGGHIYTYVDLLWWNIFKIQESVVRGDVQKAWKRLDALIPLLPSKLIEPCNEALMEVAKEVRSKCEEECKNYIDAITRRWCKEKCRKRRLVDGINQILEYISTGLEELGYKSYLRKISKEYV